MKRRLAFLSRQYNLGGKVGAWRVQIANSMFYYSLVVVVLSAVASYKQLHEWFPWVSFPLECAILVSGLFIIPWIEHVFMYSGVITYTNAQWAKHQNPVFEMLKEVREDNKAILKKLEELGK